EEQEIGVCLADDLEPAARVEGGPHDLDVGFERQQLAEVLDRPRRVVNYDDADRGTAGLGFGVLGYCWFVKPHRWLTAAGPTPWASVASAQDGSGFVSCGL